MCCFRFHVVFCMVCVFPICVGGVCFCFIVCGVVFVSFVLFCLCCGCLCYSVFVCLAVLFVRFVLYSLPVFLFIFLCVFVLSFVECVLLWLFCFLCCVVRPRCDCTAVLCVFVVLHVCLNCLVLVMPVLVLCSFPCYSLNCSALFCVCLCHCFLFVCLLLFGFCLLCV